MVITRVRFSSFQSSGTFNLSFSLLISRFYSCRRAWLMNTQNEKSRELCASNFTNNQKQDLPPIIIPVTKISASGKPAPKALTALRFRRPLALDVSTNKRVSSFQDRSVPTGTRLLEGLEAHFSN